MKLTDLFEAKLKNFVDPFTSNVFSKLEVNIFFTLFVDQPDAVYDAQDAFKDEMIDTDKLVPLQSEVSGTVDNDDPLIVVRRKGINYVVDGHHRLYTAQRRKVKQLSCVVLQLPDAPVKDLKWFEKEMDMPLNQDKRGIVRRGWK